jgi:Alpha/beta hydrolase family
MCESRRPSTCLRRSGVCRNHDYDMGSRRLSRTVPVWRYEPTTFPPESRRTITRLGCSLRSRTSLHTLSHREADAKLRKERAIAPLEGKVQRAHGRGPFLAPQLTSGGYRVITTDLRGLGESSTGWDDFTGAATGSDVVALLRELHAGPAHLVGESNAAGAGVWAAAEAARARPRHHLDRGRSCVISARVFCRYRHDVGHDQSRPGAPVGRGPVGIKERR